MTLGVSPQTALASAAIAGLAVILGIVAVISPPLAIAGAVSLVFVTAATFDLTFGLAIIAFLAFAQLLPLGSLSAAKLAGGVVLLSWIASSTSRTERVRGFFGAHHAATALLVVFLAWVTAGIAWAEQPHEIGSALVRYVPNILLFPLVFAAVDSGRDARKIVIAFVIGALLSTMYGAFVAPPAVDDPTGRLSGAGVDPNQLAAGLVAALAVCAGATLTRTYSGFVRVLTLICVLILFFGLVVTASRTGIIALAAIAVAAIMLAGPGRRLATLMIAVAALGLGAAYITQAAPAEARARLQEFNGGGSGRTSLWKVAVRIAEDHPLTGIGSQNFPYVSPRYIFAADDVDRSDLIVGGLDLPVHNTYLELWAETGVVGLALFLGIVGWVLACGVRAAQGFRRVGERGLEMLSRSVVIATCGMLAAGFFLSFEHEKSLWILFALAPALLKVSRRDPAEGTEAVG